MELVPLVKEHYSKFYKGDSYVIYSASEAGRPGGMDEKPHAPHGPMEIHIHFWLGLETTNDEAGVAAIKTVELDSLLGGGPVQHRETEGHESKRFLSYFKYGIRYLNGGISSGFSHFSNEFHPSLYHVKGKKTTVVIEVPEVSWSRMNNGDVYVLHAKQYIFVWTGRASNNMEKLQGAKFATALKQEQGGGTVVVVEDGQENGLDRQELTLFNSLLPLNKKSVIPASKAPHDDLVCRRICQEIKLFRCSDEGGILKVIEVKSGPFYQSDLDSNDSFILDNGVEGIWVWVGKQASKKEREEALRNAQGFVIKKGYPDYIPVTRVIDGGESFEFKSLFKNWKDKYQSTGFGKQFIRSHIAATVQTKFDASTLHAHPQLAAEAKMMDDGSGQREIWRVRRFDLVEVPQNEHGEFFMGDCYVLLYAYVGGNRDNYVVYYWIGSQASQDEAGTAAARAVEIDMKLHDRAVQVRVVQGKEPPHLMAILGGRITIFKGGYASSFDGISAEDQVKKSSYMLQIRGTSTFNTKAIESSCFGDSYMVDMRAGCLNSNDCFLVVTPQQAYLWCGKGSTGDEREMAKSLAKTRGNYVIMSEGCEKDEFWQILGGRERYANSPRLIEEKNDIPGRLFHCSNASGVFRVDEIMDFDQSDLIDDDIMILDSWDALFIWVGRNSNKEEQNLAEKLAFEYLRTDPAGRGMDTTVVKIKQGFEPPTFTGFFGVWDNDLWNNDMTYADICNRLQEVSPGAKILVTPTGNGGPSRTYSLVTLREKDPERLPEGVDPTRKEDYLCDADFSKALGIERTGFKLLPEWKKISLKKSAGIF